MRYNLEFSILWPSKADQFLVRENISVLNTICLRHECVLINEFMYCIYKYFCDPIGDSPN